MNRVYSQRVQDIKPFRVMEVLTRAKELEQQGHDIVHLEVGEPDFATAAPIIEAGRESLARGQTQYSQAAGIPELRQALSQYYLDDYGLSIAPSRIMITAGASGALLLVAALLMNPGDGMLMSDPGYPCNRNFLRLVEGRGQLVPVGPEHRFQLQADRAEQYWQHNTVGVMVASPSNPTGEILSAAQLAALWQLCQRKNGYLVVDEIYHGLSYDAPAPSILAVTDQAFVINSFSKYFGMTGWRLGWLVAPEQAVPALERLAQNLFISMSTFGQYGALAAFEPATRSILDRRRDEFALRRDYLLGELQRLGFDIPHTPAGAFYIYAGIKKFSNNSEAFCLDLLENHGLAITPGVDFGDERGTDYVRFAYTTSMDRLREAVRRLQQVLG
ncbi:MAG: aspartate/methionine/tyrosine aminotransferase [Paraglaciecola psychrophila]